MNEVIEIQNSESNFNWNPFIGDETNGLLRSNSNFLEDGKLNSAGQRVLNETYRIMQSCGNPNNPTNAETGIVIGYVQSGKTLSFTTLTALARDNNYKIVIILGGTSELLLNQSTIRLRLDLKIDTRYGFEQKWTQITNPFSEEHFNTITDLLDQWANPIFPRDRCRTILITVMKNGPRLRTLTNLLQGMNLNGVPTLIIDDEGDQASLNTRARWASRQGIDVEDLTENEVSTIYRRINGLRNIFPHHTFLQYTATPGANLFINIMDRLSPNFVKLLTPGDEYTGGTSFFKDNQKLIVEIPVNDLPSTQPLFEPAESLLKALRLFYLGVVAGTVLESFKLPGQHHRSMLIHPSRLQDDHTIFFNWIINIKNSWTRLLSGENNEERDELLKDFYSTYKDLLITVPNLPPFELLSNSNLALAIQYTPVIKVNASGGKTPSIPWNDNYSWILVGGQSMDRGFTINGLTVTYMPRNTGINVDTIHQRARFFGYKLNYLGYCRVFLDQVIIDEFSSILENEENVREQLEDFDVNNKSLNEWTRKVVLDRILNLTRTNILYDLVDRDRFGDEWFKIKAPHDTEDFIETNRSALLQFLNPKISLFKEDVGHPQRTEEQKHLMGVLSLQECLDDLLNNLRYTRESDSATYSSLRGVLKRHLQNNPNETCLVYLMSAKDLTQWVRIRGLNSNDEIINLHQGRNPRTGEIIYPGDTEIKNPNILTIQIHMLNLRGTDLINVPTLAIWIPDHIGVDIIRQP